MGLTISNTQNSFFKAFYEAYEVEVKNQPSVTAFLNNANDNQDVQNQQIEEMISQGAKALVINLADVNQGGAIIGKYCNQVALVFFNRNPGDKALAKCQNAYFVDGDATQAGVLQGLKVLELWKENPDWDKNKDGKIQFAMLEGLVGHAGAQARTKWAISTMESYPELGIPVESVFHEHAMFNKEIAKETVSRWALSPAFGRVEIILANNDAMALGASGALSERQINLPIFGIDATSEALDAIKADRMTATVLNDATNQAKVALRLASNLAADVSPLNGIDYRMEYRVIQVPYQEVQ
ncbi:galactose ABC transporter substrate-binding protein [Moraxella lacunata]|uniref:galactose ABC transporter substrate-binding protein n=1 Tax=Moraxella lacunata TaxID=477 RepID=UPI003EE16ED1